MKVRLSPKADEDLVDIIRNTRKTFGDAQAKRYFAVIQDGITYLQSNPEGALVRSLENLELPFRFIRVKKHYLFFVIEKSEILIIRILHTSMDYLAHLP